MTRALAGVPRDLLGEVVQQRYFLLALGQALTGREVSAIVESSRELQDIAVVGQLAVQQATARGEEDIARTALVQSLAASAGASLLAGAAEAIRCGEDARRAFAESTRRDLGMAEHAPSQGPDTDPPSTAARSHTI